MQTVKAYAGPLVPVRLTFAALHAAWGRAGRGKQPSSNQLSFASRWLDALQGLHQPLCAGTWVPRRTVSFVVNHPKTREIHAPDFADRVVAHCRGKLAPWVQQHVSTQNGLRIRASANELTALQHLLASYWGHFGHAHSVRLRHAIFRRMTWLQALFGINPKGEITPRWVLQGTTLAQQVAWLRAQWPQAVCHVQKGLDTLRFAPLGTPDGSRVYAVQTGWQRHGTRRREINHLHFPESV